MTRAEKMAIRAKRVADRNIRMKARDAKNPAKAVKSAGNTASTTISNAINVKNTAIAVIQPTTTTTTTRYIELPDLSNRTVNIEICIHCFRYQRRLSWMLSSILQQTGDVPNILVNISHTDDDGTPTTEEVCNFFRAKGLNIKETKVTMEEVPNRAIARNKQATETTADFILFSDSDIVYDPLFFDDLQKKLKTELKDIKVVMGADRHSLQDKFCIDYFSNDQKIYPCVIETVSEVVKTWPVKRTTGKDTVAGYFQLINTTILREICGGLVTGKAKDYWRNTKGDRSLRIRVGGRYGIKNTCGLYHLNHDRLGPDIQR